MIKGQKRLNFLHAYPGIRNCNSKCTCVNLKKSELALKIVRVSCFHMLKPTYFVVADPGIRRGALTYYLA